MLETSPSLPVDGTTALSFSATFLSSGAVFPADSPSPDVSPFQSGYSLLFRGISGVRSHLLRHYAKPFLQRGGNRLPLSSRAGEWRFFLGCPFPFLFGEISLFPLCESSSFSYVGGDHRDSPPFFPRAGRTPSSLPPSCVFAPSDVAFLPLRHRAGDPFFPPLRMGDTPGVVVFARSVSSRKPSPPPFR